MTDPSVSVETRSGPAETLSVPVVTLDPGIEPPRAAHPDDAGMDLVSRVDVVLQPGERALVPTGIALALPTGHVGLVHPRSGLAAKHGITVVNAPGTVDAGYRGEVMVCLLNTDTTSPFTITRGDRIAQLVVQRFERVSWQVVDELPSGDRGSRGHGSTGQSSGGQQPAGPAVDQAPSVTQAQSKGQQ